MNLDFSNFSDIAIYKFLFFSFIFFIFFRIINFLSPFIIKKNKRKIAIKILIVVEIISWFVFTLWAIQFMMHKNQLFAMGISILFIFSLCWAVWYYLRDIVAGIYFSLSGNLPENKNIIFDNIRGKITKKSLKNLEIKTNNNERIFIPYSKLLNGIFSISEHKNENLNYNNTFSIEIKKQDSIVATTNKIKIAILQLPWVSMKSEPKIFPIAEYDNKIKLDITVSSIEDDHIFKIKKYLEKKF